jgi:hypothetical protein
MRRWTVLLLLVGMASPAMAAKSVSVSQLEQLLTTLHGKSDRQIADQIAGVELTQRVSVQRLAGWEAEFHGDQTRGVLTLLADESAFLDPPVDDVEPSPVPDVPTQERMLRLAVEYVNTTMTRMPNFYATRSTQHFEDQPAQQADTLAVTGRGAQAIQSMVSGSDANYVPLHKTDTFNTTVTYQNGYEVTGAQAEQTPLKVRAAAGLTTGGEFGPMLSGVMRDAIHNQIKWGYWERGTDSPIAVFTYAVPLGKSNYAVGVPNMGSVKWVYPSYHGEIAVDPATGSVLRLTVVAELPAPHERTKVAIAVEDGLVMIGNRSYICPIRGVAYSQVPVTDDASKADVATAKPLETQLNDVTFKNYHLFRAEARIIARESGKSDAAPPPPVGAASAPNAESTPTPNPDSTPAQGGGGK